MGRDMLSRLAVALVIAHTSLASAQPGTPAERSDSSPLYLALGVDVGLAHVSAYPDGGYRNTYGLRLDVAPRLTSHVFVGLHAAYHLGSIVESMGYSSSSGYHIDYWDYGITTYELGATAIVTIAGGWVAPWVGVSSRSNLGDGLPATTLGYGLAAGYALTRDGAAGHGIDVVVAGMTSSIGHDLVGSDVRLTSFVGGVALRY